MHCGSPERQKKESDLYLHNIFQKTAYPCNYQKVPHRSTRYNASYEKNNIAIVKNISKQPTDYYNRIVSLYPLEQGCPTFGAPGR